MELINVGIVGLGWPGARHAEGVRGCGLGHLYGGCDLNEERREVFRAKHAPEKLFSDYDALLADPALHAVVIALPNALHYPSTLKALQAGKHVLCEKPPTLNAEQMREIRAEAERRGLIYFFGRQMRFSGAMQAARQAVAERRLGEIYYAQTKWVRSRGTPGGIDGWFTDKSRAGGGALIDLGVHAIDAAWYVMGTPAPRSVTAQTYQKFPQLARSAVFDVEDNAYGLIRLETGALVNFEVAWAANLTDEIPMGKWGRQELFQTTWYGPKGTLRVIDIFQLMPDTDKPPLSFFEDQNGELVSVDLPLPDVPHQFIPQMRNFLEAVKGEAAPVNSALQAVQLMEMLDAIYQSSRTGREVVFG